ncbi:unnamed protein product [Nippostrongylus brasiliensis]|uniref:Uncharacterized protein n=1 Tax=Nippostrongylus brasiliensis TaxID=27835 RepID=A0A0N4YL01_NIPBR|nr:unnamed protein product [Nippostrongylus brasiliensis]
MYQRLVDKGQRRKPPYKLALSNIPRKLTPDDLAEKTFPMPTIVRNPQKQEQSAERNIWEKNCIGRIHNQAS